jgi:hypothetical protein
MADHRAHLVKTATSVAARCASSAPGTRNVPPTTEPIDAKLALLDFSMPWEAKTFAGKTTTAAMSLQNVFVTSGPAHDVSFRDGGDRPNVPTFRRLRQAMRFAAGVPATAADFVLSYRVQMKHIDPNTGFPRGIRKEDVKVDVESGRCHEEP